MLQSSVRSREIAAWTERVLGELARDRSSPHAWGTFMARSFARWRQDAQRLPELRRSLRLWLATCVGGTLAIRCAVTRKRPSAQSLVWLCTCALMADWHLGMIPGGDRPMPTSVGRANRLTILRACLPAAIIGAGGRRVTTLRATVAGLALLTDFADGQLARRCADRTHFGTVADPLVDSLVWPAIALSRPHAEGDSLLRWLVVCRYGPPVPVATALTFIQGRTFDWRPTRLGRWSSAGIGAIVAWSELHHAVKPTNARLEWK